MTSPNFNKTSNHPNYKFQDIEIYLDMDGVISDFDSHAIETGFRDKNGQNEDYTKLENEAWYEHMPIYKGARKFYDVLNATARVRILTAPIMHPSCFSGKAKWLMNFIPERKNWILRDLMIVASKDKHLVAGPGRVLIDDRKSNTDAWAAAGGIAVHHQGDYAATLADLNQKIEAYQKSKASHVKPRQKKTGPKG